MQDSHLEVGRKEVGGSCVQCVLRQVSLSPDLITVNSFEI